LVIIFVNKRSPANSVESIFVQIHCEILTGKPRLDFNNQNPYSINEANEAFVRVAERKNILILGYGWN
jgi:hypothetical protein